MSVNMRGLSFRYVHFGGWLCTFWCRRYVHFGGIAMYILVVDNFRSDTVCTFWYIKFVGYGIMNLLAHNETNTTRGAVWKSRS